MQMAGLEWAAGQEIGEPAARGSLGLVRVGWQEGGVPAAASTDLGLKEELAQSSVRHCGCVLF